MKYLNEKKVYRNIRAKIEETSVLHYIKNSAKKNCDNCDAICGASVECYSCLLTDENLRRKLETVVSKEKTANVYIYLDQLQYNAERYKNVKLKRLGDILEALMFLKTL